MVFLFSLTCHKAAHALVAKLGGDPAAARGGEVITQGVLIVVRTSEEGHREVLGVWVADSENEARRTVGAAVLVLERRYPKLARLLNEPGEEILALYQLAAEHRRRRHSS